MSDYATSHHGANNAANGNQVIGSADLNSLLNINANELADSGHNHIIGGQNQQHYDLENGISKLIIELLVVSGIYFIFLMLLFSFYSRRKSKSYIKRC